MEYGVTGGSGDALRTGRRHFVPVVYYYNKNAVEETGWEEMQPGKRSRERSLES